MLISKLCLVPAASSSAAAEKTLMYLSRAETTPQITQEQKILQIICFDTLFNSHRYVLLSGQRKEKLLYRVSIVKAS